MTKVKLTLTNGHIDWRIIPKDVVIEIEDHDNHTITELTSEGTRRTYGEILPSRIG